LVNIKSAIRDLSHKADPRVPLTFIFNKFNIAVYLAVGIKCKQTGYEKGYMVLEVQSFLKLTKKR
jgi:hypothetical protein